MTRRKRYSAEFKREALNRANEEGVTDVQTLFVTFGRPPAAWQIHASVRRHIPIHTTLFEVL